MHNDDPRSPQMVRDLIASAFPADHITRTVNGADVRLYAFTGGTNGPSVSAAWTNGRFVIGWVDGRSFTAVDRYLTALNDLVRWLADV